MRQVSGDIRQVLEPVVSGLGYQFVGAEFGMAENGQTLRIYIDKPEGVVLEDCAAVSQQLSAVLDVEDPIDMPYLLEVSSPGVDRPLFNAEQFAEVIGQTVKLKASHGVDGRRNFKGTLTGVTDGTLDVEVDGQSYRLVLDDIEQAHLKGEI